MGEASTILLRSRWLRFVIRADCSEGYDEDILPTYARTSPLRRRPLGPLAGIWSAWEEGMPFSWRSWATDG